MYLIERKNQMLKRHLRNSEIRRSLSKLTLVRDDNVGDVLDDTLLLVHEFGLLSTFDSSARNLSTDTLTASSLVELYQQK